MRPCSIYFVWFIVCKCFPRTCWDYSFLSFFYFWLTCTIMLVDWPVSSGYIEVNMMFDSFDILLTLVWIPLKTFSPCLCFEICSFSHHIKLISTWFLKCSSVLLSFFYSNICYCIPYVNFELHLLLIDLNSSFTLITYLERSSVKKQCRPNDFSCPWQSSLLNRRMYCFFSSTLTMSSRINHIQAIEQVLQAKIFRCIIADNSIIKLELNKNK